MPVVRLYGPLYLSWRTTHRYLIVTHLKVSCFPIDDCAMSVSHWKWSGWSKRTLIKQIFAYPLSDGQHRFSKLRIRSVVTWIVTILYSPYWFLDSVKFLVWHSIKTEHYWTWVETSRFVISTWPYFVNTWWIMVRPYPMQTAGTFVKIRSLISFSSGLLLGQPCDSDWLN